MTDTLIRLAARALNPDRPIMTLAAFRRSPRPTAKSWATGHRRPPIWVLQFLQAHLRARQFPTLADKLEALIVQREWERKRKPRIGFWIVDPATGQNKANRLGRPRKGWSPSGPHMGRLGG
jgi:hypothetical protein